MPSVDFEFVLAHEYHAPDIVSRDYSGVVATVKVIFPSCFSQRRSSLSSGGDNRMMNA